jgi:drug/metabolite transporter (DMT)-like permease
MVTINVDNNKVAILLMIMSAFIYSLQNLDVKVYSSNHNCWSAIFSRGLMGTFLTLTCISIKGYPIRGTEKGSIKQLTYRGLLGGITNVLGFYAIANTRDLGITTILMSTSPVWTLLLTRILTGNNTWVWHDATSVALCSAGVGVIFFKFPYKEYSHYQELAGDVCAILSALSQAGVNMLLRNMKTENAITTTFYSMMGCVLMASPGFTYELVHTTSQTPPTAKNLLMLTTIGILSCCAQWTKTVSLQLADDADIVIFRYLEILFAIVWEVSLLHKTYDTLCIVGCVCILLGCLICVVKPCHHKQKDQLPDTPYVQVDEEALV